jgi:hypothetical protein
MPTKAEIGKYRLIVDEAVKAANEAGDKWIAEHTKPAFAVMDGNKQVGTMLDVCGFAYVDITDKRPKFVKWLIQYQDYAGCVHLNHKYRSRQEMGLNEATAEAMLEVFRKHGVEKGFRFFSRID